MGLTASCEPLDRLVFTLITDGAAEVATAGARIRVGPGDVYLHPVGAQFGFGWNPTNIHLLDLPLAAVAEVAATNVGITPDALCFESMTPVSAAAARFWRATVAMVNRELVAPDSALANPLVQSSTFTMLAAAALGTFPNTTMSAHTPSPRQAGPAGLRRAIAFIDENADRPLTVADVASVAGTSGRALQHAFHRHYNTTPTAYLRRVRLERSHRELQAADPTRGDTVAAVAARWGFVHLGRFATVYRRVYGQPPSHTLRG
jgi:AraC-like DNA-binding protein